MPRIKEHTRAPRWYEYLQILYYDGHSQANPSKVERSRAKGLVSDVANDVERAVQLVRDARRAKRPGVIVFQGNSVALLYA